MRIVFFGTSNVALPILEELIKEHEIAAVVTQPDAKVGRKQELTESPVSSLATDLKMNLLKPENVKNNPEFLSTLQNQNADIFVVVSYGKILPNEIINLPKFKSVNVHFSPLPKYRGASPMQAALLNGDEYTGISFFVLDEQPDHGPLIYQQIEKIDPGDNFFTLSDKLARASAKVVNSVINDYTTGKVTPLPQDDNAATFTPIISKADGQIDWNRTAGQIYNQFRAYFPWPGIWTKWNGKMVKITDCKVNTDLRIDRGSIPTQGRDPDPTINNLTQGVGADAYGCGVVKADGLVVCGGISYLQIKSLQLEGKNETDIKSFLNGYPNFIGSQLE